MIIVGRVDLPAPWNVSFYENDSGILLVKDSDVPREYRAEYDEMALHSATAKRGYAYLSDYELRASRLMRSRSPTDDERNKREALIAKVRLAVQQADRGEFADYSLESLIEELLDEDDVSLVLIVVGEIELPPPFNLPIFQLADSDSTFVPFIPYRDIPEAFREDFEKYHSGQTHQLGNTAYWDDFLNWAARKAR